MIENNKEVLKFFDDFFYWISEGYYNFQFKMQDVTELSIETLLYIISLDKIYKEEVNIKLNILVPTKQSLKKMMIVSGFTKYFRANIEIDDINVKEFFPICDGYSNREKEKDDGLSCAEIVDFTKDFFPKEKSKDQIFRLLYNSIAELMLNTDNHAYDNKDESIMIQNNWYLFAVKLDNSIVFYFFDNGKGITTTARPKIIDKAFGLINLAQVNILKSILKGEFRSQTGIGNRGKGLPQINELLTDKKIGFSLILTNKVLRTIESQNNNENYSKLKYNFRGSLFIWTLSLH